MTLTEEQLEDILAGSVEDDGLTASDRAQLAEARAVRERLRGAFAGVRADALLAGRVQEALRRQGHDGSSRRVFVYRLIPAAIAAAALLVLVPTILNVTTPAPAEAGTKDLVRVHEDNLAGKGGFFPASDRDRLLVMFREKLRFDPVALPAGPDVKLQGGCLVRIASRDAAGYLLAVGNSQITVIVTREWPDDLGLACGCGKPHCACYHKGRGGGCNLVSKRIGNYSYTVVGDAPAGQLQSVLARIAP